MIKSEWTKADALDLQSTCNNLATDCISRQAAMRAQIGRMTAIFAGNGQIERINVINLSAYRKESEAVITHRCRGSLKAGVSI